MAAPGHHPPPADYVVRRVAADLDRHNTALRRLGEEIVHMREEIARLETEKKKLEAANKAAPAANVLSPDELLSAPRESILISRVSLLQRHKLYVQRNKDQLARIQQLQNDLIKKNELDIKVLKLKHAYSAQLAFKKKLEDEVALSTVYKIACKRQERAISRFEKMMDNPDAIGNTPHPLPSPAFTLLEEENRQLEQYILRLQQKKQASGSAPPRLATVNALQAQIAVEQIKIKKLEELQRRAQEDAEKSVPEDTQLQALDARADTLEQELVDQAAAFAEETTELEMKLRDAELAHILRPRSSSSYSVLPPVQAGASSTHY
eukprot:m.139812 g.139812  ORF g.139812 m.139812 type:complete len:321 (+) comp10000_c0_seq4:1721-2683(+)